ncbi:MAG: thiamine diphosphokinase [Clostridia bacterium]|nr:thiamine diphosphokinase [Clostridia bacterium]
MKEKCIIFTGGADVFCDGFDKCDFDASYIIAADSGCAQIKRLCDKGFHILPNLLLGDMDSFDRKNAIGLFPNAEFMQYPKEKDYTDTQLAVDVAINKGYTDIEVVGGTGNRADHYLANLALLRRYSDKGIEISINDGKNKIFYCKCGKYTVENDSKFKYFSILPDGSDLLGVSITGAKYTLKNAVVDRDLPITVSNEITADICTINVEKGKFFFILCSD